MLGSNPWMTEHLPNGTIVWAASIGPLGADNSNANVQNYRVFKVSNWTGRPTDPPDAAVEGDTVYVSWNGATEVETWTLYGGSDEDFGTLLNMQNATKDGFETQIAMNSSSLPQFVSVVALDTSGNTLGRTGVYKVSDGSKVSNGTSNYTDDNLTSSAIAVTRHSPLFFVCAAVILALSSTVHL